MTISSIVNASGMLAGLEQSGNAVAGQPVPVHQLILAGIAIALWAIMIACAAAWLGDGKGPARANTSAGYESTAAAPPAPARRAHTGRRPAASGAIPGSSPWSRCKGQQ